MIPDGTNAFTLIWRAPLNLFWQVKTDMISETLVREVEALERAEVHALAHSAKREAEHEAEVDYYYSKLQEEKERLAGMVAERDAAAEAMEAMGATHEAKESELLRAFEEDRTKLQEVTEQRQPAARCCYGTVACLFRHCHGIVPPLSLPPLSRHCSATVTALFRHAYAADTSRYRRSTRSSGSSMRSRGSFLRHRASC